MQAPHVTYVCMPLIVYVVQAPHRVYACKPPHLMYACGPLISRMRAVLAWAELNVFPRAGPSLMPPVHAPTCLMQSCTFAHIPRKPRDITLNPSCSPYTS